MQMEQCSEARRFENIENDIKEIKDTIKVHSTDIQTLKEGQAETRIYVKQIFERIDDIKLMFKSATKENNSVWVKVVLELIKAIGIVAGIIAAIKLLP
jgi:archaellum component FlaC